MTKLQMLQELMDLTMYMRAVQNKYYGMPSSDNLIEAKRAEKKVDDMISEILNPKLDL